MDRQWLTNFTIESLLKLLVRLLGTTDLNLDSVDIETERHREIPSREGDATAIAVTLDQYWEADQSDVRKADLGLLDTTSPHMIIVPRSRRGTEHHTLQAIWVTAGDTILIGIDSMGKAGSAMESMVLDPHGWYKGMDFGQVKNLDDQSCMNRLRRMAQQHCSRYGFANSNSRYKLVSIFAGIQGDGHSCGVWAVEMGRRLLRSFEADPGMFKPLRR